LAAASEVIGHVGHVGVGHFRFFILVSTMASTAASYRSES
jgi:hypothetical protein